jgi:hypothetical protein
MDNMLKTYSIAVSKLKIEKFYKNKIDVFKLLFDKAYFDLSDEELINREIARQVDKSINNAVGSFHEMILGGIDGYQMGQHSGYDIKSNDDTLFADIKNKHNTMNSSSAESLFQKLAGFADRYRTARCYYVQILAKDSFEKPWFRIINGKEYSHSRVFEISGDRF